MYFYIRIWNSGPSKIQQPVLGNIFMPVSWIVTAGAILFWAMLSAVSRILLLRLELDPWSFSFIQLFTGGGLLLVISGKASFKIALTSFRRPMTWILGILRVLSASIYTAVLVWVSVLEAGILGSISIPLVAIIVWMLFGKRTLRWDWLGHSIIVLAIILLVLNLNAEIRLPILWLMLLNALCLVTMSILAERHPGNASNQRGARMGFTGSVLLITAGLFLIVRVVQGGPNPEIWNWWLLISGTSVGVLLRAPAMFLAFWSIRLIGAQNYMGAVAFLPITGMIFEQLAYATGLIDVSRFHLETVFLGFGVIVGTFFVFAARLRLSSALNNEAVQAAKSRAE